MKNSITSKFLLGILFSFVFNSAQAQLGDDRKIPWGENDSTSYVEIKNGKFGIFTNGKETIPVKYELENLDNMIRFDGNAYYRDGAQFALGFEGKWGVMNNMGVVIVPFEYDYITIQRGQESDEMEYAGVEKGGKVAIMDGTGKLVTGFVYDAFYGYFQDEGMISYDAKLALRVGDKVVFYDPKTKKTFDQAPTMEFGVDAKIEYYNKKFGVIAQDGKIIVPFDYDFIYCASSGRLENRNQPLTVGVKGKCGIWQLGKGFILPMEFESAAMDFVKGKTYFVASQNGKFALLDGAGKNVTPFEYDYMSISFDIIKGTKGEKEYVITTDGKAVLK